MGDVNQLLGVDENKTQRPPQQPKNSVASWLRGLGFVFALLGLLSIGVAAMIIAISADSSSSSDDPIVTSIAIVVGIWLTSLSFYAWGEIIRLLHEINLKLGRSQ